MSELTVSLEGPCVNGDGAGENVDEGVLEVTTETSENATGSDTVDVTGNAIDGLVENETVSSRTDTSIASASLISVGISLETY